MTPRLYALYLLDDLVPWIPFILKGYPPALHLLWSAFPKKSPFDTQRGFPQGDFYARLLNEKVKEVWGVFPQASPPFFQIGGILTLDHGPVNLSQFSSSWLFLGVERRWLNRYRENSLKKVTAWRKMNKPP